METTPFIILTADNEILVFPSKSDTIHRCEKNMDTIMKEILMYDTLAECSTNCVTMMNDGTTLDNLLTEYSTKKEDMC